MGSRFERKISRSRLILLCSTTAFIAGSFALAMAPSAWAQPNSLWGSQDKKSDQGIVQSDQMLDLSNTDASSLRLEGEQALRFNDLGHAITVLKRAVELAPTDMSGRVLLAEALEKQIEALPEREAPVYNLTVKQWLYVAKEAGSSAQQAQAMSHLKKLTGSKPGPFESTTKYLSKVLMPDDAPQQLASKKEPSQQ